MVFEAGAGEPDGSTVTRGRRRLEPGEAPWDGGLQAMLFLGTGLLGEASGLEVPHGARDAAFVGEF